jgi:organic hydroperoxide reductase OsmC/OhrA
MQTSRRVAVRFRRHGWIHAPAARDFILATALRHSVTSERLQVKTHQYTVNVIWTGNTGAGTAEYRGYERAHDISVRGKPLIPASADPAFRGDASRYNPEELLVASISSCHMLWYLHLAVNVGIVVTEYSDSPLGTMAEAPDGSGAFTDVVLRPRVTVLAGADPVIAGELHHRAHAMCFVANSLNFPVRCEPALEIEADSAALR